jgi:uncharacterized protein YbjQ (UPF0145 family)
MSKLQPGFERPGQETCPPQGRVAQQSDAHPVYATSLAKFAFRLYLSRVPVRHLRNHGGLNVTMRDKLSELDQAQQSLNANAPYSVSQRYTLSQHMVTTAFTLDGFRIVRTFGVVRGITVRSRSIFGTLGGTLHTLVGGNITAFTRLCEVARAEAFEIMVQHASEIGANAVIGMRYDANEIMNGVTEVLAYGTAVVVEPIESARPL